MRLLPLLLVLVLAACTSEPDPDVEVLPDSVALPQAEPVADTPRAPIDESALLGGWACDEGIDPEIDFRLVDGERVFASYLHSRPSHSGMWRTEDGTLTVETDDGLTYLFPYVVVSEDQLVLEGPAVRWACTRIEA